MRICCNSNSSSICIDENCTLNDKCSKTNGSLGTENAPNGHLENNIGGRCSMSFGGRRACSGSTLCASATTAHTSEESSVMEHQTDDRNANELAFSNRPPSDGSIEFDFLNAQTATVLYMPAHRGDDQVGSNNSTSRSDAIRHAIEGESGTLNEGGIDFDFLNTQTATVLYMPAHWGNDRVGSNNATSRSDTIGHAIEGESLTPNEGGIEFDFLNTQTATILYMMGQGGDDQESDSNLIRRSDTIRYIKEGESDTIEYIEY